MGIDWSFLESIPGAITKGPRHCKVVAKVKAERKSRDEAESDKVRERSGGRCEICGQTIARTTGERPSEFRRRKFCSLTCSQNAERLHSAAVRAAHAKPCVICGSVTDRPPALALKRKYCSFACAIVDQRAAREAKRLALKCRVCGNHPRQGKRMSDGGCCSIECFQSQRRGRGRTRTAKACESCGTAFVARLHRSRWSRFCSAKCLKAELSKRPAFLIVQCEQCCAVFRRTAAAVKRQKRIFCSKVCQHAHMVGDKSPAWRGGSNPNRGAGWIRLAALIRERDGLVCQRCNKAQQENGEALSVDHIVPWRMFKNKAEANDPTNLISLCRGCHSWKTNVAERKMLIGDNIVFEQYKRSIRLPPLFAAITS